MNFLDNFYGILFNPDETFDKLKQDQPLLQAFFVVLAVSLLSPIVNYSYTGTNSIMWLGFGIMSAMFSGVFSWLFVASFIDILASVFKLSGRIKEFLVLSGFALIPWVFIGSIELFKTGGVLGNIVGILLGFTIWIWVLFLEFKAAMKVYNLSPARVVVLIVIPFLGSFLAFSWFIGFISTFMQIIKA